MVVVAAVDSSDAGAAIVTEADILATQFDEELHVLHAMSRSEFVDLETTSVTDTGKPVDMDRVREIAADIAAEAAAEAGVDSCDPLGKVGDPSDAILDYARDVDARYVVIGSRKRSPTGKAIFGSVTQSTLLGADRPVVVVGESVDIRQ
jgi:nucleotide-binding universal stress UspA family protein